tara:strand:- start:108 stop:686 length:579 start_codon:yes stop_codon:yes gene_type:complete
MNRRFNHVLILGLLALLALPMEASANRSDEERSLIVYLGAHEFEPSRKILDKISHDTNRLLIRVSGYKALRPTLRVRAIAALSLYPTQQTQRYLLGLFHERSLKKTNTGLLIRRQALRSAASAFGVEVVDEIKALRSDNDPNIRDAVAHALGDTKLASLIPYLKAWLPHENTYLVRGSIERSIDRLSKQKDR